MGKLPLVTSNFSGGQSADLKEGPPASFAYSRHTEFRKNPTLLSPLPAATKETGTTVTDLIVEMIELPSGKMVGVDLSGNIYTRTTGGVWAKNGTQVSSCGYGMVYNLQLDTIFVTGKTSIHTISNADGRFGGAFTVNSQAIKNVTDQSSAGGHANTYTVPTSISEASTALLSIIPTIEPLYSLKLWVTSKGTGDVTVTMHDAANNVLGTVTITNANLTAGAYNEFVFAVPPRMYIGANNTGQTYHFHVTVSTGTTTIGTSTASDFSTADFQEQANRLVQPNNGFHPAIEFLQYLVFLNERYLAVWEPITASPTITEFNQHRVTFPSGFEGTSACLWQDYIVVGAEKRSTNNTTEFQEGKLFLWDGTSTTYNIVVDIPEGAPYGLFSHKGIVYYFAGGTWWAWSGTNPVAVFKMPNSDFEFTNSNTYMINYPHTISVYNGLLAAGFPSETNSQNIEHGVYTFGSRNKNYPASFGFSWSMSTGSLLYDGSNAIRIGMVKAFGDKLFISWRDDSQANKYGVDKVDPNSVPYTSGSLELLITDFWFMSIRRRFPRPEKDKMVDRIRVSAMVLPTGATVKAKYKVDREASWHVDPNGLAAGDTLKDYVIQKHYKEGQFGIDWTCGTTPFYVTSVTPIIEMLETEMD